MLVLLDKFHYQYARTGLTRKTITPASALNRLAVTIPRVTIHKETVDGDFEAASLGVNRGSAVANLLTSARPSALNSTGNNNQHSSSELTSYCQEEMR